MVSKTSLLFLFAITGLGWSLQLSSDISPSYEQEQQQYSFLTKWGTTGISFGKFSQPLEIAIDLEGNVYVTDFTSVANKVQKFTNNGTFITSWGSTGLADGQFINPGGLTVDSAGNIYVGDFGENNRVQKFDSNGNFITKWGSRGANDGQLIDPTALTVDSSGNIYVVDQGNSRIQVFGPS